MFKIQYTSSSKRGRENDDTLDIWIYLSSGLLSLEFFLSIMRSPPFRQVAGVEDCFRSFQKTPSL